MCQKLLIFQKIYDLTLWLYPIINRIPKSHRLVLGKHLEQLALSLLLLVIKKNRNERLLMATSEVPKNFIQVCWQR